MYKLMIILLLLSVATAQDIRDYVRSNMNNTPSRESSACAKSTYNPNVRVRVKSISEIRQHNIKR